MNVLVVAAHPDDEVLGAGGAIAHHVALGDTVHVVIVADCESARNPGVVTPGLPDATKRAADLLGVSTLGFLGFRGMTLRAIPDLSLNRALEDVVKERRPDVVYTHYWNDLNDDHNAVARAMCVACRPLGATAPARLLAFEIPSSTEQQPMSGFAPTVFVDLTESIDLKLEAMDCYRAELRELPHPRNVLSLRRRAAYWGQHAGVRWAEPFMLMREVVRGRGVAEAPPQFGAQLAAAAARAKGGAPDAE